MTGVILCGGNSSRMGHDKATLKTGNMTWTELAATKFAALPLPYVCSVAGYHQNHYHHFLSPEMLIADEPDLPVGGPLKGILSVHKQLPGEDLFVLAVDMPLMSVAILKTLMLAAQEQTHEAYVFENGMQLEPLCGIYTAVALCHINTMVADGSLNRFSMQHVLSLLQTKIIPVDAAAAPFFINCNTPEDLQNL